MEVNDHLHAVLAGAFADFDCCIDITVASAIALAIFIIRIIPDPKPYCVDAGFCQNFQKIALTSIVIMVDNAAFFQRK